VKSEDNWTPYGVMLFYPNLIGYIRIVFMAISFWHAIVDYRLFLIFYLLAFGGDVVDGYVARAFNQSSTFGGILDMVTDRCKRVSLIPSFSFDPFDFYS